MPNVADRDVVVLAPEEGNRIEALAPAEDVACGHLSLALRDHPVFHPDAVAGVRVGPPGDVTRREDAGRACFEELVHEHTAIGRQPRALGKHRRGTDADAHHHDIGIE